MRALLIGGLGLACVASCAELTPPSDGTSISVGKANDGALVHGSRIPDRGDGFITRDIWKTRGNRYGTDELLDLIAGVARRMQARGYSEPLVVADISAMHGGAEGAAEFHHSHQSGRDADLNYFLRDAHGPVAADAMRPYDDHGKAKDDSGLRIDVPRTWQLVRELISAPEANVQWIFMYEPIAKLLLDHARDIHEPDALIARARATLLQPSGARHDDHLHVRVFCSDGDLALGCADFGKLELRRPARPEPAKLPDDVMRVLSRARAFDLVLAIAAKH